MFLQSAMQAEYILFWILKASEPNINSDVCMGQMWRNLVFDDFAALLESNVPKSEILTGKLALCNIVQNKKKQ